MTERKPPGITWESWIDRQIRVGIEGGAFDDLPGHGKPVPDLGKPRDELWWVRDKVRREKVTHVPPAVQVRRELDATVAAIAVAPSEAAVRDLVAAINERVRWVNSRPIAGPPSTVAPLDVEAEVAAWRGRQAAADADADLAPGGERGAGAARDGEASTSSAPPGVGTPGPRAADGSVPGRPRRRWWRRGARGRLGQSSTCSDR